MDDVNYDDFKNICRVCLLICEQTFLLDFVTSKIYNLLTGFDFKTNDELPQQICLKCFEKLNDIDSFALQCKESHSALLKCLNKYKNVEFNKDNTTELIKDKSSEFVNQNDLNQDTFEFIGVNEMTVEEHKLESVKHDNVIIDELQIKTEIIEETSDEINNQRNINPVQFDEIFIKEENGRYSSSIKKVEISERPFKCDLCPSTFRLLVHLNNHKRKHMVKRVFICKICKKTFKYLSKLNEHKLIHSGQRPFICEICNKAYKSLFNLNEHKRVHSGERPFVCKICNKSFNGSSSFSSHKRIHSNERPYECEICFKTFIRSGTLNRHKRIHSGERPYVCEICNKTFNCSSHLNRHKLIHSNRSNICVQSLESSSGLQIYKTTVHSGGQLPE